MYTTARATCATSNVGSTATEPFGWRIPSFIRAVISVPALPMSIWPQAMSYLSAVEGRRPGQAGDRVLGRGVRALSSAAARGPRSIRC